jgi:uncharacterized membrane protein HdeD (DUF308 family)
VSIESFLLGVIVTASLTAGTFFLKFWKQTHDSLFLGFGAAFIIEGINRLGFLFLEQPNEGSPVIYSIRLLSYLLILGSIIHKNRG